MSIFVIPRTAIDETKYVMDYLEDKIPEYNFSELTNGRYGDKPGIYEAHPIALEYGNLIENVDGSESYSSIFPAIGVELVPDNESQKQNLGRQASGFEVDQDYIDSLSTVDLRYRLDSNLKISDKTISGIQDAYDSKIDEGKKMFAVQTLDMHDQSLTISIWADDITVRKLMYNIVRSIFKRMRFDLSKLGVKNFEMSTNFALYNYDFARTLFGSEIKINWIQPVINTIIDTELNEIKDVELYLKGPALNVDTAGFIPIGRRT